LLFTGMEQNAPHSPLLELTTRLARGDDPAWRDFHRDYGPGIFRQLLALTAGDHDLATEVLQQTYLRIARYVRPCSSAPMFTAWLRVVARTALHDSRRRHVCFWSLLRRRHADPTDKPTNESDEEHTGVALDAALASLAHEDRSLLEAKYFSGLKIQVIAKNLGLSPKAVESRLTRARAELRHHILTALHRHE
jgi:RNA polymerase sigma factor (sigma-70 family)